MMFLGNEVLFPEYLEKHMPSFKSSQCTYVVQQAKRSSMRVVCGKEFGIVCYTLEAGIGGGNYGDFENYHYNQVDLQHFGYAWYHLIYIYIVTFMKCTYFYVL